ncbi:MAG: methylglyoxal synthase [Nitratireductor sp.]|nr:methylglyoxal synthase [Nitratireductor sp.]
MRQLALIAHDSRKDELVEFVSRHAGRLEGFPIVCTGTTGQRIAQACPGLDVERVRSGPLGGDQQIGARIAEGRICALIFFIDPLTPMPHDVDVKALTRLAALYDIPMALNASTAALLVDSGMLEAERSAAARPAKNLPDRE